MTGRPMRRGDHNENIWSAIEVLGKRAFGLWRPRALVSVSLVVALTLFAINRAQGGELVKFDAAFDNPDTPSGKSDKLELLGFLARPDSAGRFPAVVILHGCAGFSANMVAWAERLRSWGYVALAVDSLGPRGRENVCGGGAPLQALDAFGALNFLAQQHFVDPDRIGILGFSMGGGSALLAVERGFVEQLFPRKFRAAVAFFPICRGKTGINVAPTLIQVGDLDDWTPAAACRRLMTARGDDGARIDLTTYPGVYHSFTYPQLQPGRRYFGHWVEYNEGAAMEATERAHRFLRRTLAEPQR